MATGKPGRVGHIATEKLRKDVLAYAAAGVRHDDIATALGISRRALQRHYRHELDTGGVTANLAVAKTLFKQAMSGNTAAMIFWLKVRAGWSEKQIVVGANDGPVVLLLKGSDRDG